MTTLLAHTVPNSSTVRLLDRGAVLFRNGRASAPTETCVILATSKAPHSRGWREASSEAGSRKVVFEVGSRFTRTGR
jgi:hypothetical protein